MGRTKAEPKVLRNPFKRAGFIISTRQLRGYQIVKRIGSGAYGRVFSARKAGKSHLKDTDVMVALKVVNITVGDDRKDFLNEVSLSERFSTIANIGPTFLQSWKMVVDGKRIGVITMRLWDTSLGRFMDRSSRKSVPRLVLEKISAQLRALHRLGYAHMDLHSGNILVKVKSDRSVRMAGQKEKQERLVIVDATLADFGHSMALADVDEARLKEVVEWYELPKTTRDPKQVDLKLLAKIKREWK